jgi:hypothetical protein
MAVFPPAADAVFFKLAADDKFALLPPAPVDEVFVARAEGARATEAVFERDTFG